MKHAALARSELSEGMGHLWQAAGHAAGGMGAAAGPTWRMARRRMMTAPGGRRQAMMPSLGAARRWGTKVAAMTPLAAVAPTGGAMTNRWANRAMTKVI